MRMKESERTEEKQKGKAGADLGTGTGWGLCCARCFLSALSFLLFFMWKDRKKAEELYAAKREAAQEETETEPEPVEAEEPEPIEAEEPEPEEPRLENTVDFEELQEMNEDIYAWIEIPGTLVDYPVVQHPTDDAY